MSLFERLLQKKRPVKDEFETIPLYRKGYFGSCYPNLTIKQNKELKNLFPGLERRTRKSIRSIIHSDAYYNAKEIISKNGL